jgi:hypothetical protein
MFIDCLSIAVESSTHKLWSSPFSRSLLARVFIKINSWRHFNAFPVPQPGARKASRGSRKLTVETEKRVRSRARGVFPSAANNVNVSGGGGG